ncbi:CDP-glycerol glycerophosphotransferase family protein, partial [Staphylococcus aureus]
MSLLIHINIITKTRRRYDMIKTTIKKLIEHSIYTTFKLLSKLPNKNLIYFESFH